MTAQFLPLTPGVSLRLLKISAVLFALALIVAPTLAQAAIPDSERAALIAFYNSTHGETWVNKAGWLGPSGTECDWYGVTCDAQRGHVLTLEFFLNNLTGIIPPEIVNLSHLTSLNLSANALTGDIPAAIGSLGDLELLRLSDNRLSGVIPPQLGQLSRLQSLILDGDGLTGVIPPHLGNLTRLRVLFLYGNQLSGSIPTELGRLVDLEVLVLKRNRLTGNIPKALATLSKLQNLDLSYNSLVGKIPEEFVNLHQLNDLFLSYNQLTGKIPEGFDASRVLFYFDLSHNRLSGRIPESLGNVTASFIKLEENQLSGTIPPFHAPYLDFLGLARNHLTGALPADLGDLPDLNGLDLAGNRLSGEIPVSLWHLIGVDRDNLDLRWNALWSHDPALVAFLNGRQIGGDFQSSQTVPPEGLQVAFPTGSSLVLSWSPILYQDDAGGYQVLVASRPQGPFTLAGTVVSKALGSYQVTGLQRGTTYYFCVCSSTLAHPPYNQSDVMSPPSAVVAGTTSAW